MVVLASVFTIEALADSAMAATPSGWNIVTSPATGADDIVLGSTCSNSMECLAVGITITNINSNGVPQPFIERTSGSAWSLDAVPTLPNSDGGGFFGVTCVTGSDCWAVGAVVGPAGNGNSTGTLTEHWDGAAWSFVPSPTPPGATGGFLQGVSCSSSSDCWAVGYGTDQNGGALHAAAEHWDGRTWTLATAAGTGQTFDQLDGVTCLSSTHCWAVGSAGVVQQNPNFLPIFPAAPGNQGLVEQWDGHVWSVVPSVTAPNPAGGYLSSVACPTSTDCWASGSVTNSQGMAGHTLMEHWNGSFWVQTPTPDANGSAGNILASVTCLGSDQCWSVGSSGSFGGGGGSGFQPQSFIEAWNGSTWSIQPSPNVTALSFLNSVTCVGGSSCWAVGSAATQSQQNDPGFRSLIEQMILPPNLNQGLFMVARDGGVFTFGNAQFAGSMGGQHLNQPVVAMASTPGGLGYREVASDGGIFAFGDAAFYGSMGGQHLNAPIVGIAPTPDGKGYWEVGSDGGIFAFGDAGFYGSMGGAHLNRPVVGIAASADGGGYWEVASDGGIFAFGDAPFHGSMGNLQLNQPITAIAATPDGNGYWLAASDGGTFTFGNAPYLGSAPGQGITSTLPVVGVSGTPDGGGYWLTSSNGSVYAYGDATFLGSLAGSRLAAPISGIAAP
jgi:hypothetical protein